MKKRRMKLLALFLSCSMTVGMITPVSAEPVEQEVELAAMQEESVAGEDTSDETVTAEDAIAENAGTEAEDEINETVSGEEEFVEDTEEETKEEKKESATAIEKTIEKIVTVLEEQKSKPALTSETEEAKTQAISVSVLNSEGVASGMYSMENAIITKQEDGSYLLKMHQSRMNRNYMAIVADQTDESKNAATNHEVDWYIGGGDDGYWYVIPVASLDTPVYASFSNTANVEAGKDWSNIMAVMLDAESCTATDAADVTAAEMNIQPAVEPEKETKTQAITVSVLNSEGAPSGMYSMENAIITKQEDGSYLLKMHQSRMNRNYMAIVADQTDESKNAATNHEVDWYIGGGDDGYWYVIPVASLDTPVYVSFSNTANVEAGKDWSNIMTVVLDAESCTATEAADVMAEEMNIDPAKPADPEDPEKDPEEDPKEDPEKDPEEDPKDDPEKEPEKNVPADGTYTATATTGVAMFKVVDAVLTVKNGELSAVVTLSGTGYDYLFMGTKAEAFAADSKNWIPAVVNADGQYTYTIPVAALDTPLAVASRSARYASEGKGVDAWIDRTITIESASLKAVSKDPEKDPGKDPGKEDPKPTPTPKPDNKPNNKPAEESKYESDTSGSTSAVDSSTTLKDGTYTPDSFAFSGGTGKVNITCPQITVKNGKAFATLVFSSSSYQYVKANGNKYNTSKSGSTASVTIPVELNKNNTIIGMTTKMSAAHEIQYSIFIYLAAADGNKGSVNNTDSVGEENKLDDKAPEILGLKAIESDKEVKSDYLKIFEYEGGIKLVEIAMTKDTVLDPELVKKEEKTSKKADQKAADDKKTTKEASASAEDAENPVKPEQTLDEVRAELYQQDVVKYLVVPKGADIPAGLDKQVIVINLPVKSTYASSAEAVSYMDQLNLLSNIKAVGFEKEDCENKNLKKAMEEEKAVFAGSFDKPKAKEIVKQKTDLVLESDELLPLNESVLKDRASDKKNVTDEKDVKAAKENEKLSTEDYRDRMTEITDRMAALNIPMLIDRSADEKTELGKAEWIRLYGILFNCEDEAEKLYEKTVSEL